MTSALIQLDEYFRRIHYDGPREPTLETLGAIVLAHSRSIPFENLNPLLRWPVALDPASLESKLIRNERGGYCYEQNLLLRHVLTALGFTVQGLLARVLWNVPPDVITPRSHMVLLTTIGGRRYTADVGFGTVTPTAPLLLEPASVQQTPNEYYRYVEADGEWTLEARVKEEWRRVYRFNLEPQHQVDYEVANWYTSTHPSSHFLHSLIAAKAAPGCRYTLLNDQLAIHYADGRSERRKLSNAAEIRDVLVSTFDLRLPPGPELDSALQRLLTPEPAATVAR
jgi:N-hydroxyarylamine O-acetyltransferase